MQITFTLSIIELTPLGAQLGRLIYSLNQYNKYYSELTTAVKERVNELKDISVATVGWTKEEKKLYYQYIHDAKGMEIWAPRKIIDVLILRYALISSKFRIRENNTAKAILNSIIIDEITQQTSVLLNDIVSDCSYIAKADDMSELTDNIIEKSNIPSEVVNIFESLLQPYAPNNKFVRIEFRIVISAVLSILKPSREFMDNYIEGIENNIQRYGELIENDNENERLELQALKERLVICNQAYTQI